MESCVSSDGNTALKMAENSREEVDSVVGRFAGDSGDGIQLTGGRFAETTAIAGQDLETFPDFPAEIRAPIGTPYGVSAFPINFGGRCARCARRAQPGGANRQYRGNQAGWPGNRRFRLVQRKKCPEGRLRQKPARRRQLGKIPRFPNRYFASDIGSGERYGSQQTRWPALQEYVDARPDQLDV